jgi:hypothetical protein
VLSGLNPKNLGLTIAAMATVSSRFFLFFAWIWLVISVFIDIFRSPDLSGSCKTGWIILVLFIPFIGVLIYLIARGDQMQQRKIDDAKAQNQASQQYIQSVAGSGSTADELTKLGELRDNGTLTDAEYQSQKTKLLA